jgi:hypothetical protein
MNKIAIVLLFSGSLCFSQDYTTGNARSFFGAQVGTLYKEVPIEGSAYVNETYTMGKTYVNGREMNLLMRYNAISDQVEMIDKRQKRFNLLKRLDLKAEIEGKTYVLKDFYENGALKQAYFNPLNEGKVVLLFRPKKVFIQAERPENGYDTYDPPRYKDDSRYYLQRGVEPAEEISLSKGQVLRFLRDQSSEVKAYIRQHDLKLRDEAEIIQVLEFYNGLNPNS